MNSSSLSSRHHALLDILKEQNFATVSELSQKLYISEITVRRDLKYLESQGLVHRSHGGALPANIINHDVSYAFGVITNTAQKQKIAQKAVSLVDDGATIFLDASSSSRMMIPHLTLLKEIFIFTHGLENALLSANYGIKTFCIGGKVNSLTTSCVGVTTLKMLEDIHPDYCFFSSRGLSEDGLVTHHAEDKSQILKTVIRQSRKKYLLCDHTKAGIISTYTICRADDLDGVIIDQEFPFDIPNKITA